MKLTTLFLTATITFIFAFASFSQRGKEGDMNVMSANTVLNTYTYTTAISGTGSTTITVADNAMNGGAFSSNLAAGDLIMIIQMQGSSVDINNFPVLAGGIHTAPAANLYDWWLAMEDFGSILNYKSAGFFQTVEVAGVSGTNTIELQCALEHTFVSVKHVQVVRIPRFNDLTVSGGANSIIPNAWDGQSGGVVALEVDGVFLINSGSSISASGFGFRGGQLDSFGQAGNPALPDEIRYLGSPIAAEGSEKGESIYGYHVEYDNIDSRYGIGATANGGGGGGYQNCGGGGGSNVSASILGYTGKGVPAGYPAAWDLESVGFSTSSSPGGGRGGYALSEVSQSPITNGPNLSSWNGDARKNNGGLGGHPLIYDAERLFFGGGGGAGDQDSNQGGAGGAGGGIVYVSSYGTFIGSGSITANGADGQNTNPTNQAVTVFDPKKGNDGAGGGGGGGAIYIESAAATPTTITLSANGGNGGNQNITLLPGQTQETAGPGGAGAGGYITYTSGTPIESVSGGINGTTNTSQMAAFPPNGATMGGTGISGLSSGYYDLVATDTLFCGAATTDLSVTLLGTLPVGSSVEWYTQEFGGVPVNTGLTYTGLTVSATTTYYIGVCGAGDFRVSLTVTIVDDNLVVTDPAAVCAPLTIDITLASVTAGSDAGTLSYWTDVAATSALGSPTTAISGTYYIELDAGSGCTSVQPVVVTVDPLDDATFSTTPSCDGGTVSVSGTPGGNFFFNTPPADAAVIDGVTGVLSGGTPGATYDILYVTSGVCSVLSTQSLTALSVDDATFTMTPTCDGGIASVSGTPGGVFTFNVIPTDAAVIDASTGIVTGGTLGATYDVLYTTTGACPASSVNSVVATLLDDATFAMTATCDGGTASISGTAGGTFSFAIPPTDAAVIDGSTGTVSGGTSGMSYDVMYATFGACSVNSTVSVTALIADDPSFTVSPTCDGGTASITGTAGGVFTFNIVPTDAAVIDVATGAITGGTSGMMYDVLYTTTGVCPISSVQSVTALTTDDATFTMSPTCDGGTASVSGTLGGVFTFDVAPLDAAVVDASTGTVSGGTFGSTYDVLYTTLGTCPASNVQSFTVLSQDDASFNLIAACNGATANVTGLLGGVFTFDVAPTDAAVIDAVTGEITGGSSNTSYDVLYTTTGTCPGTSVETVVSLTTDDASFTVTAICSGATANITGTTGGVFSFNVAPPGLASIDAISGQVANVTNGVSYDILYTTTGVCSASSVSSFTALNVDDATFSMTATCDGGTASVSGTVGGVFTFAVAPLDAAVIDAVTGVVSSATPGASYDIIYTTTGGCPVNSMETLVVLAIDDPSFTTTPTCDGGTSMVSGAPGGIFSFNVLPTDAAVIDAVTGAVTGGSSNTSYDILYTTTGTCPDSSVQTVLSLTTDDASFTMTAICSGATANITGTVGGVFSFNVAPPGPATIDAASGQVSNVTNGVSYDILYTTSGVCSASSVSSFTALDVDDATFSVVPTCVGGSVLISGTPGGVFAFAVAPLDATVIDAVTGVVSSGTSGVSYNIVYTTNGACPSSSTEVLTILTTDDPLFMISPTCDGGVSTVLGTPGGMFTFNSSPTDTASIDAVTGIITGGSPTSTYEVLYVTSGACPSTSVEMVTVDDCTILIIPTAFTPDNNGDNDQWEILELDFKYPDNIVSVYNRWGDLVFEYQSSAAQPYDSNRWDGTYKGTMLPVGSYYYIIKFNDGDSGSETGTVSIILLD